MIKKLLRRLGLLSPTTATDEHVTFQGDHVSLQRKNYPTNRLSLAKEYALYSDLTWKETVCFLQPSNKYMGGDILKKDVTIEEAIKLLQKGYTSCPF